MNYSELCNAFYMANENNAQEAKIGLLSANSQGEIASSLFTFACTPEYKKLIDDYEGSTYIKWFSGKNGQHSAVWKRFVDATFDEKSYCEDLEKNIVDKDLPWIAQKLGVAIEVDGKVNKHLLSLAVTRQMVALAKYKKKPREVDNIVKTIYSAGATTCEFQRYIVKASKRYNVMKLIGGAEVPLEKFHVCNTIGDRERVFTSKNKQRGIIKDNPNLQIIRDFYKDRGVDNLRTVLLGSGGCGKTLMLQHFFLMAAKEYGATGIMPVFLELRYLTKSEGLLSYIVKTVSRFDNSFDEQAAIGLLSAGNMQLLMDGFDEIDPDDINSFLTKLTDFLDTYDNVQVVITSRQNESLTGLRGFKSLYVHPFGNNQSETLIDKILDYTGEEGSKEEVLKYINKGFLQKDGVFASHPLLLTFVTMKYPEFRRFTSDPALFYRATFEALLSGHDDNKKPYDRVFMSVDNAEQFSIVFKEFCAVTLRDGVRVLSSSKFQEYFDKLISYTKFENPKKCSIKNFKHDVCSTACMMYEDAYDLYYIDPGFQECLFADYYAAADKETVVDLEHALRSVSLATFLRLDALEMLYKQAELKMKSYVLLPLLDEVFKGKDDNESFSNFLFSYFDEMRIVCIDEEKRVEYMVHNNISRTMNPVEENIPKTVLLNFLLKHMEEMPEYEFSLYAQDKNEGSQKEISLPEGAEESGKLMAQMIDYDGEDSLLIDCKPNEVYEVYKNYHKEGKSETYICDNKGELVTFGRRITIEGYYLMSEQEKYVDLINNVIENSDDTYKLFERIKKYYKKLKVDKHRGGV